MAGLLPTVILTDRRKDFKLKKQDVCLVGGSKINCFNTQFTNFPGACNISTQIPESQGLIRSSELNWNGTLTMTVLGVEGTAGAKGVTYGGFALNSSPIYRIIQNITMVLGSKNVSWGNINNYIDIITRIRRSNFVDWSYNSAGALTNDNCTQYVDFFGTPKNVLAAWYTQTLGQNPNTRLNQMTITNFTPGANATTAAVLVINFDIWEPFWLGPFISNNDDKQAFVRAGSMQINISTGSDYTQMFSADPLQTQSINSIVFSGNPNQSNLYWCYQTLDISDRMQSLGPQCYPSFKIDYNTQSPGVTVAARSISSNITISQLALPTQPELIILAVRPASSSKTCFQPDFYLPIVGCNLNYINNNVLSISAPTEINGSLLGGQMKTLYNISQRNGLSMDYSQWVGSYSGGKSDNVSEANFDSDAAPCGGGFLVLSPQLDLASGKDVMESPGVTSNQGAGYLLSGTLTVFNPAPYPVPNANAGDGPVCGNLELVILRYVPQSYEDVSAGGTGQYDSLDIRPNTQDVTYVENPFRDYSGLINSSNISGGSIFTTIGNLVKTTAIAAAEKAVDYCKMHPEKCRSAAASAYAKFRGRGYDEDVTGGAAMSRNDMQDVIDHNSSVMRRRLVHFK
ncbi:MAG: hypothetical protein WCN88_05055 [Candidatus Falkowbacteria bacterium]